MTSLTPDLDFARRLSGTAAAVDAELARLLGDEAGAGEIARPERLLAAMRHAVLAGGKRFRPFLLIECARLFGVDPAASLRAAAAVECLHTYSLVHDDLPAMDDDDLRRGVPTVHRAFDEATAILAGDALLTLAFATLAGADAHPEGTTRAELVAVLARASGPGGMVGGQMLDLAAENAVLDAAAIGRIQAMKTGALIAAACEMGAILGAADEGGRRTMADYGRDLGLAFQIADDLLDAASETAVIGKAAGKDAARGKATFVSILGIEGARTLLDATVARGIGSLGGFGNAADVLRDAARFAAARKN